MAIVLIEKKDDRLLAVWFEYNPSRVVKIKSIKGKCWHPAEKYWTVPFNDNAMEKLSQEGIRKYLLYLYDEKKVSDSLLDQTVSALKFLFNHVLHKPDLMTEIPRPKREHKLPEV